MVNSIIVLAILLLIITAIIIVFLKKRNRILKASVAFVGVCSIIVVCQFLFSSYQRTSLITGYYVMVNQDSQDKIFKKNIIISADSSYYIKFSFLSCQTNIFNSENSDGSWKYFSGDVIEYVNIIAGDNLISLNVVFSKDSVVLSSFDMPGVYFIKR